MGGGGGGGGGGNLTSILQTKLILCVVVQRGKAAAILGTHRHREKLVFTYSFCCLYKGSICV